MPKLIIVAAGLWVVIGYVAIGFIAWHFIHKFW